MLYVFYSYIIRGSGKCDNIFCGGDQHHRWWSKQTWTWSIMFKGFPGGASGKKNPLANAGDVRDVGSIPWLGRFPWRREKLPIPVSWPREFHGLYSPRGHKESDMTERPSLSLSHLFNLAVTCIIHKHMCAMCWVDRTRVSYVSCIGKQVIHR